MTLLKMFRRTPLSDPSMVLYLPLWKLDGSVIRDQSVFGYTCTVTGALWTPQGRYFDYIDDKISCGLPPEPTTEFTYISWINLAEVPTANQGVYGKQDVGDRTPYLYFAANATARGTFKMGGTSYYAFSDADLVPLNWYCVAYRYSKAVGKTQLVINGIPNAEGNAAVDLTGQPTNPVTVGYAVAWFFKGWIGEIRLHNRYMTLGEIQNLYLATKWRYL